MFLYHYNESFQRAIIPGVCVQWSSEALINLGVEAFPSRWNALTNHVVVVGRDSANRNQPESLMITNLLQTRYLYNNSTPRLDGSLWSHFLKDISEILHFFSLVSYIHMTHWELSANSDSDLKLLDSVNVVPILVLLGKPSPDIMHMPRVRTHTTHQKIVESVRSAPEYFRLLATGLYSGY